MIRNKEALVNNVKKHLMSDKIYVFGINKKASDFIAEYACTFNIEAIITDNEKLVGTRKIGNQSYKVLNVNDFDIESGEYIIVCTNHNEFTDVYLTSHGCCTFYQYIWLEWLDIFMSNKKVIMFAGNCQIDMIYYYMKSIKSINEDYVLMVYHDHLYKSRYSSLRWNYYLAMCDIYVTNNINHSEKSHKIKELPEHCKIIQMQRVNFDLYWPNIMISDNGDLNNNLNYKTKKLIAIQPHGPFDAGDRVINQMISEHKSDNEIWHAILNDDYHIMDKWIEHVDGQLKKIKENDMFSDIKIYPYIEENWKKEMCFNDPVHMSTKMNWYVTNELLKLIGHKELEDCQIVGYDNFDWYLNHCTQVPVYPKVAKELEIEWVTANTRYDVAYYNGIKKQTFEEYYKQYITAARKVFEVTNVLQEGKLCKH